MVKGNMFAKTRGPRLAFLFDPQPDSILVPLSVGRPTASHLRQESRRRLLLALQREARVQMATTCDMCGLPSGCGSKKGTQKTLLVKGKIDPATCGPRWGFLFNP